MNSEDREDALRPEDEESAARAEDTETDAAEAEVPDRKDLDPAEERDLYLDRLRRLQAEFENYRKRITREQSQWSARALERLVLDLLPVVDSFELALAAAGGGGDAKSLLEGMKLVHRQLVGALGTHGVTPIESEGSAFDPKLHEAFLTRPVQEGEEAGTLVQEIVKGYRMGDRTIRATRGIVTVAPQEDSGSDSEPQED